MADRQDTSNPEAKGLERHSADRAEAREGRDSRMFTTIGEILIDFTPVAERDGVLKFAARAGGSPANVAIGLVRLGAQAEFAGKVSTDFFGRYLLQHLEREGVGTRFVSRSPAPSALAFVTLDRDTPSFEFYGTGTADVQLREEDLPRSINESAVLHFGSISLLGEATSKTVLALVDRLRGTCLLSLDPNVRPSLIDDADAYRRILGRAFRAADVVKVSIEDLRWLEPALPIEDAAAGLLAQGALLVVVTLGPTGCYARTRAEEFRIPAPHVTVVDTVGAGDAFSSGLLASLAWSGLAIRRTLERSDSALVEKALRFATAAATLTCTRAGANPPYRDEIERFLRVRLPYV